LTPWKQKNPAFFKESWDRFSDHQLQTFPSKVKKSSKKSGRFTDFEGFKPTCFSPSHPFFDSKDSGFLQAFVAFYSSGAVADSHRLPF